VRIGLVTRTPRGRVATPAAWRHFGLEGPVARGLPGAPGPGATTSGVEEPLFGDGL